MKKLLGVFCSSALAICMLSACAGTENPGSDQKPIVDTPTPTENESIVVEDPATDESADDVVEDPATDEAVADVVEQANIKPKYSLDGKSADEIVALLNTYTNNIENDMTTDDIGNRFEYDFTHDEFSSAFSYSWYHESVDNGLGFIEYRFYSSGKNAISLDVKDYCTIRIYLNDHDIASTIYDTYVNGLKNFDNVVYISADEKGTNAIGNEEWNFVIDTENNVYKDFQAGLNIDTYEVHLDQLQKGYMIELKIPLNVEF